MVPTVGKGGAFVSPSPTLVYINGVCYDIKVYNRRDGAEELVRKVIEELV
jgi:hypothetical protein